MMHIHMYLGSKLDHGTDVPGYLQGLDTSNRCPLPWQHDVSPETMISWHFYVSIHVNIMYLDHSAMHVP